MAQPQTIRVRFQLKSTAHQGPVVCSFPGGIPPSPSDGQEAIDFKMYGHTEKRKSHHQLIQGETSVMRYTAQNSSKPTDVLAIGLVDKDELKKGGVTVNLVPLSGSVFTVSQDVRSATKIEKEEKDKRALEHKALDYQTKTSLLVEEFGSKKRQRMVRSNAANRINLEESIANKMFRQTTDTIDAGGGGEADKAMLAKSFEFQRDWIPPHNASERDPAKVYNIEEILGADAWAALKEPTKVLLKLAKKPSAVAAATLPEVVKVSLTTVAKLDKATQKIRGRSVCYLSNLLTFLQLGNRKKRDISEDEEVADDVQTQLLSAFTCRQTINGKKVQNCFNERMQQKLMCYLAVVCLSCHGQALDETVLNALAKDLKMTVSNLLKFFKEVGCASATTKRTNLSAPLVLQSLKRGAKAR